MKNEINLYFIQDVPKMPGKISGFRSPHKTRKIYYVHIVLTQLPRYRLIRCLPQFFRILFVRTRQIPSLFNFNSKGRDTSANFWYTSDYSHLFQDIWKVRRSMIRCVQERFSSGVGYFKPFFVNFDLISKSIKLPTSISSVLCQS